MVRGTTEFKDNDYLVTIGEGKRIIGLTAKLRSKTQGSIDLIDEELQNQKTSEKTIVALGVVVFDEANPICARHPSSDYQYTFQWLYANLDANGDSFLDQTELERLGVAVPELESSIKKGGYSMSFNDFIITLW